MQRGTEWLRCPHEKVTASQPVGGVGFVDKMKGLGMDTLRLRCQISRMDMAFPGPLWSHPLQLPTHWISGKHTSLPVSHDPLVSP